MLPANRRWGRGARGGPGGRVSAGFGEKDAKGAGEHGRCAENDAQTATHQGPKICLSQFWRPAITPRRNQNAVATHKLKLCRSASCGLRVDTNVHLKCTLLATGQLIHNTSLCRCRCREWSHRQRRSWLPRRNRVPPAVPNRQFHPWSGLELWGWRFCPGYEVWDWCENFIR